MLKCPGKGCNFIPKSDRALTTHVGKCEKAKAGLALIAEEVEQRQAKRQRVLSPEHPEADLDSEEPMVCSIKIYSWWMAYWCDYPPRMRISRMTAPLQWSYPLHPSMKLDLLQGTHKHPSIHQHPFIHLPLLLSLIFTKLRKMNLARALGFASTILHWNSPTNPHQITATFLNLKKFTRVTQKTLLLDCGCQLGLQVACLT